MITFQILRFAVVSAQSRLFTNCLRRREINRTVRQLIEDIVKRRWKTGGGLSHQVKMLKSTSQRRRVSAPGGAIFTDVDVRGDVGCEEDPPLQDPGEG